jgi:hypothetical protein
MINLLTLQAWGSRSVEPFLHRQRGVKWDVNEC